MRPIHLAAALALLAGLACGSGPAPDGERPGAEAGLADALCAEHGVLEAVCTQCNPALIPVFQAKGDWCPEHGFPLSFCPVHHPERGGRPALDVSPDDGPATGLKIRFKTRDTAELAGITTVPVTLATGEGGVEAVAHLTWDASRQALVGARAPGVVLRLQVDVGSVVAAGDPLATVQSATAAADRSGAAAARHRLAQAESAFERKRGLSDLVSRPELAAAEQEVSAARAALQSYETAAGYVLTAPIGGVVIRRDVTIGAAVDSDTPLFEIVDASRLWAEIDVPEREVARVRRDQPVSLRLEGVDGPELPGLIEYVAPSIDPGTRTTLARCAVENPSGALRANMYGTARILVGGDRAVWVVPTEAVQRAKGVDVVFVKRAIDEFETRRVEVVRREGDRTWLGAGVAEGDEVVAKGAFQLRTEILKDSIGAGCCDVE